MRGPICRWGFLVNDQDDDPAYIKRWRRASARTFEPPEPYGTSVNRIDINLRQPARAAE